MFITFEGIEGSGKTTQIQTTASWLKQKGLTCITTREPGSTDIGSKIRAILLDPLNKNLDHMAEMLLYMADRAHHIGAVVKPALTKGKTILCDRYFDATLAYQGYARGIDIDLLKKLHLLTLNDFKPDLTLLLDLSPETGLARAWEQIDLGARTTAESRFENEKLNFHQKVRAGYLELAKQEPERFRIIDASQNEDQVQENIRKALSSFFPVIKP
ncbi:Thymidylate kinase [Desulfonema limicola]|uniref:Thymidylate kinase n=1 Tax=Desulfonema limicola TaxID=45656 RepID=A0A975B908_9BACT|nr:dTMP kinase [Desulfonema limicola]QTA80901.1 Thymidylate kinase [Desulfonema limicola]